MPTFGDLILSMDLFGRGSQWTDSREIYTEFRHITNVITVFTSADGRDVFKLNDDINVFKLG